ncbi:MAG: hypothetical protein ACXABG_11540 [Promethearchaeota archaeon]|jgi:hypothetical protein
MLDNYTAFVKKTEILCKGLYLDENLLEHYRNQGIEISYGRKGGAGPSGGRYFLFDNQAIVNAALWNNPQKTSLVIKENTDGFFEIFDRQNCFSPRYRLLIQHNLSEMRVSGMRRRV